MEVEAGKVVGRFEARTGVSAHKGYLLAGAVLSVAEILFVYGVSTACPEGASGFSAADAKIRFHRHDPERLGAQHGFPPAWWPPDTGK